MASSREDVTGQSIMHSIRELEQQGGPTMRLLQLLCFLAPGEIPFSFFRPAFNPHCNPLRDSNGFRNLFSLVLSLYSEPPDARIQSYIHVLAVKSLVQIRQDSVEIVTPARDLIRADMADLKQRRMCRAALGLVIANIEAVLNHSGDMSSMLPHAADVAETLAHLFNDPDSSDENLIISASQLEALVIRMTEASISGVALGWHLPQPSAQDDQQPLTTRSGRRYARYSSRPRASQNIVGA